jgi:hypothetical protein
MILFMKTQNVIPQRQQSRFFQVAVEFEHLKLFTFISFAFVLESLHFKKEDTWSLTAVMYPMNEPLFNSEKSKKYISYRVYIDC